MQLSHPLVHFTNLAAFGVAVNALPWAPKLKRWNDKVAPKVMIIDMVC